MSARNAIASVAVRDLSTAVKWYERLLARSPDVRPINEVAGWKFAGGGWLQLCELPKRAGTGRVTLAVRDIDEQAVHLRQCGIDNTQRLSSSTADTIVIADPDGNHVALAQADSAPLNEPA